ncbi:2-phospho-L-lactate guanylyltransferase [Pseudonocardia sp. KRD-184]|uniref:Phosphoenolpyruvate guanylyltransferase n=1 Tax=Pseudonocardia oceani TaxID=2792013 RepID=A0ABS6U5J6_9PSEU|nr:2-phospho-L-lactate guanylyltransferase [Pseudonocardia oceani]MBW0089589.1 2-phospho-L-lactate guanylyltransferase [Pseudonocardia oceani]MBW0096515.1 2-phospho-L-lactate guanylyltransferase [Pseudonocardia oceani]MBW0122744.1 2-phospho-L-lactate guanylyltransferase [Pseudonocardia oceani]MBW0127471.1 2-phospho-L-lactate guanylyltransferase [Pseudonocardia oceani]
MDPVDLVVPVKRLVEAKTRLRGAAGDDPAAHARLALALARDTVAAARTARLVHRLLVVSSDPVVALELTAAGVEVVPDGPEPGLNAAYAHGAALLRARRARVAVAALQADLPALRPDELDAALAAAAGFARAFVADADGTGTALLTAAAGVDLDPRFGVGSAADHAASGAVALAGDWPGLRRDVDTPADLAAAGLLGLGERTRSVLAPCAHP